MASGHHLVMMAAGPGPLLAISPPVLSWTVVRSPGGFFPRTRSDQPRARRSITGAADPALAQTLEQASEELDAGLGELRTLARGRGGRARRPSPLPA